MRPSLFPEFGKSAKHPTIWRVAEPTVAGIPGQLLLAIPNGLRFVHPALALVVRRHQHEQVVKFRQRGAHSAMVIGFMPIGESLLRMLEKSDSRFEELWSHTSNQCDLFKCSFKTARARSICSRCVPAHNTATLNQTRPSSLVEVIKMRPSRLTAFRRRWLNSSGSPFFGANRNATMERSGGGPT